MAMRHATTGDSTADLVLDGDNEIEMMIEANRIKSFGKKWPFNDSTTCGAKQLAAAGFFYIGTAAQPDSVKCFVCFKELEGWDPTDDPWAEHKSHSKECPFGKIGKAESEITVEEMWNCYSERRTRIVDRDLKMKVSKLKEDYEKVLAQLEKMV